MSHDQEKLTRVIQAEIAAAGPISFAQFMELALYHPVHGYYQQSPEQIGCQGDFYTSVSVGDLFGQLLAWQFAEWSRSLLAERSTLLRSESGDRSIVQWVEAGAHDGKLAHDILAWVQRQRPELFQQLEYWIIEPSDRLRRRQSDRLQSFSERVRWFATWADTPARGVIGVSFSNELLDAFPVVRAGWDANKRNWFEWRVTWNRERFELVRFPELSALLSEALAQPFWRRLPNQLLELLPDGFTVDLAPGAASWWTQAAQRLQRGYLLTFDYGLEQHELLAPHRHKGTLRSYQRHVLTSDPLALPGAQDLTAHVDFSALGSAGEKVGLSTHEFATQGSFLTRIAARVHDALPSFGGWSRDQNRQLQTLIHPQHLGQSFRVLQQSRGEITRSDLPFSPGSV
jgi:SAM-dependent MidA family methyltransferase